MPLDSSSIPETMVPRFLLCVRISYECPPTSLTLSQPRATPGGWEYRRQRAGCHIHMQIAIEWQRSQIFDRFDAIKEAGFDWELWLSSRRRGHCETQFTPHLNYKLVLKTNLINYGHDRKYFGSGRRKSGQLTSYLSLLFLHNSSIFSRVVRIYNIFLIKSRILQYFFSSSRDNL